MFNVESLQQPAEKTDLLPSAEQLRSPLEKYRGDLPSSIEEKITINLETIDMSESQHKDKEALKQSQQSLMRKWDPNSNSELAISFFGTSEPTQQQVMENPDYVVYMEAVRDLLKMELLLSENGADIEQFLATFNSELPVSSIVVNTLARKAYEKSNKDISMDEYLAKISKASNVIVTKHPSAFKPYEVGINAITEINKQIENYNQVPDVQVESIQEASERLATSKENESSPMEVIAGSVTAVEKQIEKIKSQVNLIQQNPELSQDISAEQLTSELNEALQVLEKQKTILESNQIIEGEILREE